MLRFGGQLPEILERLVDGLSFKFLFSLFVIEDGKGSISARVPATVPLDLYRLGGIRRGIGLMSWGTRQMSLFKAGDWSSAKDWAWQVLLLGAPGRISRASLRIALMVQHSTLSTSSCSDSPSIFARRRFLDLMALVRSRPGGKAPRRMCVCVPIWSQRWEES